MGRLAIIAAKGSQPRLLAHAARAAGEIPFIIGLNNQVDADFSDFEYLEIPVGQIGALLDSLAERGIQKICLSGKFFRPSLHTLKPDSHAVKLISKALFSGDDKALKIVRNFFEERGFQMVSETDYLRLDTLSSGEIFGPPLSDGQHKAVATGIDALYQLGALDVGQCIITQKQRVIAIEGAEGTNEMIRRATDYLLISPDVAESQDIAFIKMAKLSQDMMLDPPVFGRETMELLIKAGVSVIGLHAEKCRLSDPRDELITASTAAGITLLATDYSG